MQWNVSGEPSEVVAELAHRGVAQHLGPGPHMDGNCRVTYEAGLRLSLSCGITQLG